jgi:single-strand DNA-binding protein
MANYNRVIMIGNLTRDPDHKQLSSGQSVCRLSIASNRQFKNKQNGSMIQEVCYIDVDVWGPQAESCKQYLQKGRPVLIEGRLKLDSWKDNDGQNRNKHTIVADRVVFLASSTSDIADTSKNEDYVSTKDTIDEQLEKDLMNQIEEIKTKTKAKKALKKEDISKTKENDNIGEVDFKDQPPFEDDLPF